MSVGLLSGQERLRESAEPQGTAYRGLTVADPQDIADMKVVAIGGRGSRKDFVDLFFYLKSGGTLEGVITLLHRRIQLIPKKSGRWTYVLP